MTWKPGQIINNVFSEKKSDRPEGEYYTGIQDIRISQPLTKAGLTITLHKLYGRETIATLVDVQEFTIISTERVRVWVIHRESNGDMQITFTDDVNVRKDGGLVEIGPSVKRTR